MPHNADDSPETPPERTWGEWFRDNGLSCDTCKWIELPADVAGQKWSPSEDDRKAAWELYTEVRTRIAAQPLPYRSGREDAALSSLVTLFETTRKVLRKHGYQCRHTATIVIEALNSFVRPLTAKWHKLSSAGLLEAEDWRHEFRADLNEIQPKLRKLMKFLGLVAEADEFVTGTQSGVDTVLGRTVKLGKSIRYEKLLGTIAGAAPSKIEDAMQRAKPQEIVNAEVEQIRARRGVAADEPVDNLVGMAISGGGIRSATFALGVLQGLASKDLLRQVDLLSTVSGGGYIGAFLSSYLNPETPAGGVAPAVGLGPDDDPFRRNQECESAALRTLRNNSKYLFLQGFLGRAAMIWQGIYGVIMNFVIIAPAILLAVLATWILGYGAKMSAIAEALKHGEPPPLSWNGYSWTLLAAALWACAAFTLPIVQNMATHDAAWSARERKCSNYCTCLFAAMIVIGAVESIPFLYYFLLRVSFRFQLVSTELNFQPKAVAVLVTNAVTFLAARGLLLQGDKPNTLPNKVVSWLRTIAFHLFWLSGPALVLFVYFILCHEFFVRRVTDGWTVLYVPLIWVLLIAATLMAIYSWALLNVNLISPHRYYRDRLAATYLLKPPSGVGAGIRAQESQRLSELGASQKAPYHLINAALNLPASKLASLRGRNADFFLFSKCFCGSPIVGYQTTNDWEASDARLDLATAIAISGAAASPQMGITTPRGASLYLTLLNIRLGYWLRKPGDTKWPEWLYGRPGPMYLLREMGSWVNAAGRYLNVSDGGHIENLGIYELLRRRCKFIVAIDGERDAGLEFPSLMRLKQFAWIDFGIEIDLDLKLLRLTDRKFSQAHFAFGTIKYPDGTPEGDVGFLLYLKLSVSGNESDVLLDYRARNPQFPHHSTAQQLYSEAQFEAYRALGKHVSDDLFLPPIVSEQLVKNGLTVEAWFQSLANNLLAK